MKATDILVLTVRVLLLVVCFWLTLWAANIINYLLSLPISWIGMLIEDTAHWSIQYIYALISTGIAYCVAFWLVASIFFKSDVIKWDYPVAGKIFLMIAALIVVVICDVRVHEYLPGFMASAMDFLHSNCHYRLLATIDWMQGDLSGSNISFMQYAAFDTAVPVGALILMIFGGMFD